MSEQDWEALSLAIAGTDTASPSMLSVDDFTHRLRTAVRDRTWDVQAINDLGNRLFQQGADAHAAECYSTVATQEPQAYGARANLGRCEIRLGQAASAEARARSMLEEQPDLLPGWQLLIDALVAQQRLSEALSLAQRAMALLPDHVMLARQCAMLAERLQDHEAAALAFARVRQFDNTDVYSLRSLVFYRRSTCQWEGLGVLSQQLLQSLEKAPADALPFELLSEPASAGQQLVYANGAADWIKSKVAAQPIVRTNAWFAPSSERLRVGFLSHGFGPHPTTILTAALFEQLRESRLEVHLFSTRDKHDDAASRRLIAAAHAFHAVGHLSQREIAERIEAAGVEVLVDLDGYCRGRKPEVFAYRPAPLQASWLAYPGTTGADFMDYVIADRFVLPAAMQPHFSEKVAYLPRCYQCTDPGRKIGLPPSRRVCGLPSKGLVYACFNASYKLNPRSVVRMLQILKNVPGSVLWLLRGVGRSDERLRELAQRAGVAPARLIFMEKQPHRLYLARYRHVDLFLDTEDYNAHTTASDALWAGCPVLTRPGETFASRVAGSLNHHLGMPEWNVANDAEFVAQAVRYGRDATYRETVKTKLLRRRSESGLFDISAFSGDFEVILLRMTAHHRAGKTPNTFENV